jgi:hypothetical protein
MRIFLILCLSPISLYGQFAFEQDANVPLRTSEPLSQPWAGGLNSVQASTLDVNGDGADDLVLFERTADNVLVYIAENGTYRFAPEYEHQFPADLQKFLLLRDFNGDGLNDIFTGNAFGIKVYLNSTLVGSSLSWQHVQFLTPGGRLSDVILTTGFSGKINLQLQADDVPSIEDMDGDNDLDILTMNFGGSGQVEYHENTGSLAAANFVRNTQSWGGFTECGCGAFAFNNEPCTTSGRVNHAGGKFLLSLDANADGKMDLLFSELNCDKLYLLLNEGTTESALFASASVFPSTTFSNGTYPTVYFVDADFDGVKDILLSPGVFSRTDEQTDFSQSLHLFKNNGANNTLLLPPQPEVLLQNWMVDVGENAVPALFDYDGDGDLDLFVGAFGTLRASAFAGSIYLFENRGTPTQPSFERSTDDFKNLSSQFLYNIKPQFADVNADGKTDLAFTATSREGNTSLYYIANTSSVALSLGNTVSSTNVSILYHENVHLADVNGDGHIDLFVSKSDGAVEYWRNSGNASAPFWNMEEAAFLKLGPTTLRQNPSLFVGDANGDAKSDLMLADQNGVLSILSDYKSKSDFSEAEDKLILNSLTRQFENRRLGGSCWPVFADIMGAQPLLLVGNSLGGLQLFTPVGVEQALKVYPNPLVANQLLSVETTVEGSLHFFNTAGQWIASSILSKGLNNPLLPALASGVYLLRFRGNGKTISRRLVVVNE